MTCRNVKAIRIAIIRGTSLTFIAYEYFLFGIFLNEGIHGLQQAPLCDIPAKKVLRYVIKNSLLSC
ncbi:hypothetical protein [Candidatus Protochlamydia amoebophila]|uniref:Uncharacterized protein n=1 Tax=Candidatus Protochlamydia amoebophila TaxID=362787 RepID=A0A0C1H763_9BACT|nr:hypothetical protein [Candidatus Protochlamydia amoebophila]KIC70768.1 hypothetical protein DB44_FY00020 [Candidatus Protochlamydia amoebophila]